MVQQPAVPCRVPSTKNGVTIKAVVVRTDKTGMGRETGAKKPKLCRARRPTRTPHNDGKKRRKKATDFMGNPISPHRKKAGARDAALEAQDFGNGPTCTLTETLCHKNGLVLHLRVLGQGHR